MRALASARATPDQLGFRTLLAHNRAWFEAGRERSDATMSSASSTHLEAVLKERDIGENDDVSEEYVHAEHQQGGE